MKLALIRKGLGVIGTCLFIMCTACSDEGVNKAPTSPKVYAPDDNDCILTPYVTLNWSSCYDEDNDQLTYDLYFGKTSPPHLVKSNMLLNSYQIDSLEPEKVYYWQIVAKDKTHATTSPVWKFITNFTLNTNVSMKVKISDGTRTFGGANVYLYKTQTDRTNDVSRTHYYRLATTSNSTQNKFYAVFYSLPAQLYFLFGRAEISGGVYLTGTDEFYASPYFNSSYTVIVK